MNNRVCSLPNCSVALLAVALVNFGCSRAPSLEAKSSGFVGCSPAEVFVSEVNASTGRNQGTNTWVASCREQRFVCSETFTRGERSLSSETNCTPERLSNSEGARAPQVVSPRDRMPAPLGGGGFALGSEKAEAQRVCVNANFGWTKLSDTKFLCDGSPLDLGFTADVVVDVCRGVVCGITLEHRPEHGWISAFGELKGQLEGKYGNHEPCVPNVPTSCRADGALLGCVESASVTLRYTWSWPTGERMNLFLGKGDSRGSAPAIRLQYVKAPSAIKTKPNAL